MKAGVIQVLQIQGLYTVHVLYAALFSHIDALKEILVSRQQFEFLRFSWAFLPLPWHADQWLFMASLTETKELVNSFLCLEEELLHAVF